MIALDDMDVKILVIFADCNMNVSHTAEALGMHRNSVIYRFKGIREKTGLEPTVFWELNALLLLYSTRLIPKEFYTK